MNRNKFIATIVLLILSFSSSILLFFYQTERMTIEIAQMSAIVLFILFLIFGGFYLYFDLKHLNKK